MPRQIAGRPAHRGERMNWPQARNAQPKPEDETKRKFREALEAKQGRKGEDHIDNPSTTGHPRPVDAKRTFRRKTG